MTGIVVFLLVGLSVLMTKVLRVSLLFFPFLVSYFTSLYNRAVIVCDNLLTTSFAKH